MTRQFAGTMTLFLCATALACGSSRDRPARPEAAQAAQEGAARAGTAVSESVDDLSRHVQLPIRPASVMWEAKMLGSDRGGPPAPSDYSLVAVLRFTEADAAALQQRAARIEAGADAEGTVYDWFPADLMTRTKPSIYGPTVLPGTRFAIEGLVETTFDRGSLYRIKGTSTFVLYLFSS